MSEKRCEACGQEIRTDMFDQALDEFRDAVWQRSEPMVRPFALEIERKRISRYYLARQRLRDLYERKEEPHA